MQTDSLYTVLLTYTVSPPISGVPVAFTFEQGQGHGVNYPATLEEIEDCTNNDGEASVRLRSSDLREKIGVICRFGTSSGRANVVIQGITGVTCVSD